MICSVVLTAPKVASFNSVVYGHSRHSSLNCSEVKPPEDREEEGKQGETQRQSAAHTIRKATVMFGAATRIKPKRLS